MNLPPPRAYLDWTVPLFKGQPLGVCRTREEYDFYLAWLQEHLGTSELKLPECQIETFDLLRHLPVEEAIESLAASIGWNSWDEQCLIEAVILDGLTWPEFEQNQREQWDGLDAEEREHHEWITEARFRQAIEQHHRKQESPFLVLHSDVPYRALLAHLLAPVHDQKQRSALLHRFYQTLDTSDPY